MSSSVSLWVVLAQISWVLRRMRHRILERSTATIVATHTARTRSATHTPKTVSTLCLVTMYPDKLSVCQAVIAYTYIVSVTLPPHFSTKRESASRVFSNTLTCVCVCNGRLDPSLPSGWVRPLSVSAQGSGVGERLSAVALAANQHRQGQTHSLTHSGLQNARLTNRSSCFTLRERKSSYQRSLCILLPHRRCSQITSSVTSLRRRWRRLSRWVIPSIFTHMKTNIQHIKQIGCILGDFLANLHL